MILDMMDKDNATHSLQVRMSGPSVLVRTRNTKDFLDTYVLLKEADAMTLHRELTRWAEQREK